MAAFLEVVAVVVVVVVSVEVAQLASSNKIKLARWHESIESVSWLRYKRERANERTRLEIR